MTIQITGNNTSCLYCKQKLQIPLEIKHGFHSACFSDVQNYPNDFKTIKSILNTTWSGASWNLIEAPLDDRNFLIYSYPSFVYTGSMIHGAYLSGCRMSRLPANFFKLNQLRTLNLSSNLFRDETLQEQIFDLKKLEILNIDKNQLKKIPDSIDKLTNLKVLSLYDNQIEILPETLKNLTQLQSLNLCGNNLEFIPDWIKELTNLTYLTVSRNQLKDLPDSIGKLKHLKYLYLDTNHLSALPDSIGNLSEIKELSLDDNHLITLPESIGSLHRMIWIRMVGNRMSSLPDTINNLENLGIAVDLDHPP